MNKKNVFYPLLVILSGVIAEYSGLDLLLAQLFYDVSINSWPCKSHWLTSDVLHTGGRNFVVTIAGFILAVFILSFFIKRLSRYRKAAAYLLIASLTGPALVAIGKHYTHIYSPWHLVIFGGAQPYIRIFDMVPSGAKVGHAFPAGHSSGGFAFFSLYFLALRYQASLRYYGLYFALVLGFTFGITQQVRGAHFLSHDLFSLVVCWYSSLMMYFIFFKIFPVRKNLFRQKGNRLEQHASPIIRTAVPAGAHLRT